MANFKKTTLATMDLENGEWDLLEDRVYMSSTVDITKVGYDNIAIFAQPERIARLNDTESPGSCCAFSADMLFDNNGTMSDTQTK